MTPDQILSAYLQGILTETQAIAALQTVGYGPEAAANTLAAVAAYPPEVKLRVIENFPVAGAAQGAGGAGGTSPPLAQAVPVRTPEFRGFIEDYPEAAYRAKYQIPGQGASDFQSWLASQYAPTFGTWRAQNVMSPAGAAAPGFGEFMDVNKNPYETRARAGELFTQATSAANPMVGGQQAFMQGLGDDFASFIQNVLRNRYGMETARSLGQNLGALQAQYAGETQGQGVGFLDFLRRQYRI